MIKEKLFAVLLKLALLENPSLHDGQPKHNKYMEAVYEMSDLYVKVGAEGVLVSPEADPLILAAIGYEESRHRAKVPDGDCQQTFGMPRRICWSVGPMQLSRATTKWWGTIAPGEAPLTIELLREPETNVRVAYRALKYWQQTCGGDLTTAFGSWAAGKCRRSIGIGRRRCALAKALAEATQVQMPACDSRQDKLTVRRIQAIKGG